MTTKKNRLFGDFPDAHSRADDAAFAAIPAYAAEGTAISKTADDLKAMESNPSGG